MFDSDSGFGGGGLWIFGLLVLLALLGGGGGLFGGNRERSATVGDVQRATDFQALERQNNEGVAATRQGVYDMTGAIKDGNYNILGELRDIESVVNSGFAAGQKCCCDILRAIDGVNYNGAINTAKINETTVAQTQRILDRMAQDREASYVQRINQLELDRALCGIPRTSPYGYGIYANYPRVGGGCCGNGGGYGYGYVA